MDPQQISGTGPQGRILLRDDIGRPNQSEITAVIRLSVLDFIIQAVARALKHVPNVPEGLMVPVIHNADKLSLLEIARRRPELVTSASRVS